MPVNTAAAAEQWMSLCWSVNTGFLLKASVNYLNCWSSKHLSPQLPIFHCISSPQKFPSEAPSSFRFFSFPGRRTSNAGQTEMTVHRKAQNVHLISFCLETSAGWAEPSWMTLNRNQLKLLHCRNNFLLIMKTLFFPSWCSHWVTANPYHKLKFRRLWQLVGRFLFCGTLPSNCKVAGRTVLWQGLQRLACHSETFHFQIEPWNRPCLLFYISSTLFLQTVTEVCLFILLPKVNLSL